MLAEELVAGALKGQSATIIAGGPSLRGFDFNRLKGKSNLIAINMAFRFVPFADAMFTEDVRFIEEYGVELEQFQGHVIWHCLKGVRVERGIKACRKATIIREQRDDKYWSHDMNSLSFSSNSAVGAINMAEILGCDPIYVLGLDCRTEGPVIENFHTAYPQGWAVNASNVLNWKSDFEHWVAPNCKAKVINVTSPIEELKSSVECWPLITHKEFLDGTYNWMNK